MQTTKDRGDMIKFGTTEDQSCSMVLNFLEVFNLGVLENKSTEKGFSGIINEKVMNRGNAVNLQEAQTAVISISY